MSDTHGGFLVDKDGEQHLPTRKGGKLDHHLMGAAWAALHGGYRGNKYEGPGKSEAIAKLRKLYDEEGMSPPSANRLVVLNRASKSKEGWIHIVPRGELPNAEAGIVQILDDTALDSIMNRLQADHGSADAAGLYAGREHFIYDDSKDSEALGWFKVFNRDNDGIWANADGLTDIGREAVKNKRYKFTSFVADPSDLQRVEGNRYRVMNIETVGFTNMANGKSLLAPISNRGGAFNFPDAGASGDNTNQNHREVPGAKHERQKMKTVLTELGLSPDASEESALAAVIKLKNRITTLEPFEGENLKLKNRVTDLDTQNVDSLLASRGIKDEKVLNRLKPVLAKMETVADRVGFLDDCGYKATTETTATDKQTKLFNRDTKPPGGEKGTEEKADQVSADKIMNRAREIQKASKNITMATAVTMAKRELQAA